MTSAVTTPPVPATPLHPPHSSAAPTTHHDVTTPLGQAGLQGPQPPLTSRPDTQHLTADIHSTPTQQVQHDSLDFDKIRLWCSIDKPTDINLSPADLSKYKATNWPDMSPEMPSDLRYIYQAVKNTGLPNCMSAKIPLVSGINVEAWRDLTDGSPEEAELIDFIEFGFPLGYNGPVSQTDVTTNHNSAKEFMPHIWEFIEQEQTHGTLHPTYDGPPFKQWHHTSPMMTRPKADPLKRRIITDLSFPKEASVNAYIKKNCLMGKNHDHSLPTVQAVVDEVTRVGPGVTMFTIDINRAYKNFRACPLDWPLLNIVWQDQEDNQIHALDTAMPFGSKLSSLHFQRAANFITRVLETKGIKGFMYLDDLIVVAPDPIKAYYQFDIVRDLFRSLGLPEAPGKTQPPAHTVTFLGIEINAKEMTLSIPKTKVDQTLKEVKKTLRRRNVTRRQLQSIIGRIVHVAKCVTPARLFAARLLETLRGPPADLYQVDDGMRADLNWFISYLPQWNGRSYIPTQQVAKTIYIDACMKGIGATDGTHAYAAEVTPMTTELYNITEIEGLNVLLACNAFLTTENAASTVMVRCDNMPAVNVFTTGRGHNHLLLDVAPRLWMLQATLHIKILFHHIPGADNKTADILSRAFNGPSQYKEAVDLINEKSYQMCTPDTNIVNDICHI